jgi:hypothetical protein
VGRYLAANKSSQNDPRVSALAELKQTYSSLNTFVLSLPERFGKIVDNEEEEGDGRYSFGIVLRSKTATTTAA